MNLHAEILYGRDVHHQIEAIFKGLARALEEACRREIGGCGPVGGHLERRAASVRDDVIW